jgi:hypothetical protein
MSGERTSIYRIALLLAIGAATLKSDLASRRAYGRQAKSQRRKVVLPAGEMKAAHAGSTTAIV